MQKTELILPEFVLPTKVNQRWTASGIDSIEGCKDRARFQSYPYQVEYLYNSRGYRDREWPADLSDVIWCIGDSFTVGLGSPVEHTWPYLLEQATGRRCINLSMDGGSNNWMARRAVQLIRTVNPKQVVIHWSYLHRRELSYAHALEKFWPVFYSRIRDTSWPDCELDELDRLPSAIQREISVLHNWPGQIGDDFRTLHYLKTTDAEDVVNTVDCINYANSTSTQVINSFIPGFKPTTEEFYSQLTVPYIPELEQLDTSRDGHHYDRLTAQSLVDKIMSAMA